MSKVKTIDELSPLLEEYKQLFSWANNVSLTYMKIPSLTLTAFAVYAISVKELNSYFGIVASIAIFILLVFMGICDSMLNGIGLKIVEIELKINAAIHADQLNSLTWHQEYIVHDRRIIPGFDLQCVLLSISILGFLVGALFHVWCSLYQQSMALAILVVTLLSFLNLATFLTMILAQRKTMRLKQELIHKYEQYRINENL
jgi:hypothetical protein